MEDSKSWSLSKKNNTDEYAYDEWLKSGQPLENEQVSENGENQPEFQKLNILIVSVVVIKKM